MKPSLTLQPGEKVVLEMQPDRKMVAYWILRRWYVWVVLIFVIDVAVNLGMINSESPLALGIAVMVLFVLLSGLWVNFVRRWHWYIVTNQRCLIYFGFVFVQKRLIPLNRIVDADMNQSILERILGLGSVTLNVPSFSLNSQGQQKNLTVLSGVPAAECNQLLEMVSTK